MLKLGKHTCQYALEAMGHTPPEREALRWCIGPPLSQSFEQLLPNGDAAKAKEALAKYRERFSTVGLYENEVIPGIENQLKCLHERGHRLFVATSKPRIYAEQIIEHFNFTPYFETVHGSELDGSLVHKEDLLAHILAEHELDPQHTTMIGDREYDVHGAKAHGVHAVGVLWGYGSRDELERAGADAIVERPEELLALVY